MTMSLIVAFCGSFLLFGTVTVTDATSYNARVQCYIGKSVGNTLPSDAVLLWLPATASAFCFKQYEKSVLINKAIPNATYERTLYTWDAMVVGFLTSSFLTCGDKFETSDIETPNENVTIYHYRRYCFCCGDACNDADFDKKCPNNELPQFTHRCYSAASINNPQLPGAISLPLDCTSSQACYKQTLYNNGAAYYHWGCASVGAKGKCDQETFYQEGSKLYKGCSCCGELCNDAKMDHVSANNSVCKDGDQDYLKLQTAKAFAMQATAPTTTNQLSLVFGPNSEKTVFEEAAKEVDVEHQYQKSSLAPEVANKATVLFNLVSVILAAASLC